MLFTPKWKHDDWRVRKQAVKTLDDSVLLIKIAKTDKDWHVRQEAVEKIQDELALIYIARHDEDADVRACAIERIDNTEILKEIADADMDSDVVKMANHKLGRNVQKEDSSNDEFTDADQHTDVRKVYGEEVHSLTRNKRYAINMTVDGLKVYDEKDFLVLTIAPSHIESSIKFSAKFSDYNAVFKGTKSNIRLLLSENDLATLKTWMDKLTKPGLSNMSFHKVKEYELFEITIRNQIRAWGVGLVLMGVIQYRYSQYLDPKWGIVLILAGVINTIFPRPLLFVLNGLLIFSAGISNINIGSSHDIHGWFIFGLVQLIWGLYEIAKYFSYKKIMSNFEKARNK